MIHLQSIKYFFKCTVLLLTLFLLVPPAFLSSLDVVWEILRQCRIIVVVLVVLLFAYKNKNSKFIQLVSFMYIPVIISSLIHGGKYITAFSKAGTALALCLLINTLIKVDFNLLFKTMQLFILLYISINLASVICFPNGIFPKYSSLVWFLGYYNMHILYFIMSFAVCSTFSLYNFDRITHLTKYSIVISLASVLLIWSATSLTAYSVIILYMLIAYIKKNEWILNVRNYILLTSFVFLGIVIFRVQNWFAFLIEDVLKRNLTLTGRIYVWDAAFKMIMQKPIIGWGIIEEVSVPQLNEVIVHVHNGILQILLEGGFISLFFYAIIVILICAKLMKYKSNNIAKVLSISIFSYMVVMLTDDCTEPLYMCMLAIAYNVDVIIEKGNLKRVEQYVKSGSFMQIVEREVFEK